MSGKTAISIASSQNSRFKRKYGITTEDRNAMYRAQGGRCAICGVGIVLGSQKADKACIDHDHQTGVVRSLLCNTCNVGLGSFKDDVALLARAIVYLEDHGNNFYLGRETF